MSRRRLADSSVDDRALSPTEEGDGLDPRADRRYIRIVGGSVRAAAHSALRAGLCPSAFDLYGDADLRAACPTVQIGAYGEAAAPFEREPGLPWMYTGPLENEPEVLERLAATGPLWGNSAAVVRAARDPMELMRALEAARLPAAEVRGDGARLPRDGAWLVKPLRSSGGLGVRVWDQRASVPAEAHGFQRRLTGPTISGCFWADPATSELRTLGLTRQRTGRAGVPFGYIGSIGPLRLPGDIADLARRQAHCVAARFGLSGLFGIDYVIQDGVPYPVEVNPRYTASVEVLEIATRRSFLELYDPANGARGSLPEVDRQQAGWRLVGKQVLYAERVCRFVAPKGHRRLWRVPGRGDYRRPVVGDYPADGTVFEAGWPVLTVFAAGEDVGIVRRRLDARAEWWRRRLERV